MKKIIITLFVLITTLAEAAPYYRIWRGFKKDNLTTEAFNKAIQDIFVSATVENGAGNSLTAYIPALPKPVDGFTVPDEIALVIYESKEKYDLLKATPTGTAYTALHWDYFTRAPLTPEDPVPANISKSNVPALVTEELSVIENGQAYDLLGTNPQWQKGIVKIRFLKRASNTATELELIKKLQKDYAAQAEAFLLLADAQYFMTYELWKSQEVLMESSAEKFIAENFKNLGSEASDNLMIAKNTPKNLSGMQALSLAQGEALNAQFDVSEKAEYLSRSEVDAYIQATVEQNYATLVDLILSENKDTETSVQRKYLVRYEDEQGVPTLHSEEVTFLMKKSPIHPDQKLVVIKKAEVIR